MTPLKSCKHLHVSRVFCGLLALYTGEQPARGEGLNRKRNREMVGPVFPTQKGFFIKKKNATHVTSAEGHWRGTINCKFSYLTGKQTVNVMSWDSGVTLTAAVLDSLNCRRRHSLNAVESQQVTYFIRPTFHKPVKWHLHIQHVHFYKSPYIVHTSHQKATQKHFKQRGYTSASSFLVTFCYQWEIDCFKRLISFSNFSISDQMHSRQHSLEVRRDVFHALLWLPQGTWQCEEPKYLGITTRDPIRSCGTLKGWCCSLDVPNWKAWFWRDQYRSAKGSFLTSDFCYSKFLPRLFLETSNDFQQMSFPFNQGYTCFSSKFNMKSDGPFHYIVSIISNIYSTPRRHWNSFVLLNFESCLTCHL